LTLGWTFIEPLLDRVGRARASLTMMDSWVAYLCR
jgi:hypothetical protein